MTTLESVSEHLIKCYTAFSSWYGSGKRNQAASEEAMFERPQKIQKVSKTSAVPQNSLRLAQASVRRLFDGKEFIGAFVYLSKQIGVCAFHCVIKGKILQQETLRVDDLSLLHIISYPYFDLSFYLVVDKQTDEFLPLSPIDTIFPGEEVLMASHPCYNGDDDTFVDVSKGHVSRTVLKETPLVAAHYTSFPGCSGGAVLASDGTLMGIHMEIMYHESSCGGFLMQKGCLNLKAKNIDDTIEYPNLVWNHGARASISDVTRMSQYNSDSLIKYSVLNSPHKAFVAAFLPVYHIRHRLARAEGIVNDNDWSSQILDNQ